MPNSYARFPESAQADVRSAVYSLSKDAAGVLYDVLSHEAVARRAPRLLVVLNKSDLKGAAAAAAARKQLEAEMESVKLARTTLQDTSERAARGALPARRL